MDITELWNKSILVLGYGVEGVSTFKILRELFPDHRIGIADGRQISEISPEGQELLTTDSRIALSYIFGKDYLSLCERYEVIVKSPGIKLDLPKLKAAREKGAVVTSQSELFLNNHSRATIGVTGTKGKGTTSKLIHTILRSAGKDPFLVGNIGVPPYQILKEMSRDSLLVFELSSQQLEEISVSPHVAICLKIVPDHLDHHGNYEEYVRAKQNITAHQTADDYFIFNIEDEVLNAIAKSGKAQVRPFSLHNSNEAACFISDEVIYYRPDGGAEVERITTVEKVLSYIPGRFNLNNILPAIVAAKLHNVSSDAIEIGMKNFEALPYRFEKVGVFNGIAFYNAPISTVPEVTIEHIFSLGMAVQTLLLGGFDRGTDYTELGRVIKEYKIKNLILFPETGEKIWRAVCRAFEESNDNILPNKFSIESKTGLDAMQKAVTIAYKYTDPGKICLHSPASPSFGLFRDFRERGEIFEIIVKKMGIISNDLSPSDDESWEDDFTGEG